MLFISWNSCPSAYQSSASVCFKCATISWHWNHQSPSPPVTITITITSHQSPSPSPPPSPSSSSLLLLIHNCNALVLINTVVLHWARLVVGWVTAFGQVNCLTMQPTTQANSAFHSSKVGKWVPAIAGKAKVWLILIADWICVCAGKTVRSLENTCHTWALWGDDSQRGTISSERTFNKKLC